MTFGYRLRNLREESAISQIELSKKFKITSQALSQYELDKRMPDAIMIQKLSDHFCVSIDYLLCRSNIRNPYDGKNLNSDEELNRIYEDLPIEDQNELKKYAKYLKTRSLVDDSNKENSSTSEGK